jgi:hypothetical protein
VRSENAGLQWAQLRCPSVCAGFLLGGTCDKVLTVLDNDSRRAATGPYTLKLTSIEGGQIMNVSDNPSALKQIRKTPWKFQRTFKTPLNNLEPFVAAILSTASFKTACITIEQAVFEPKHWIDLLTRYSLPPRYAKGVSVTATGQQELEDLLHTAFTDWFDFLLVPTPKPFVIYADHDEYTTFYANTRSNLNRFVEPLSAKGFEEVAEYRLEL